MYDPASAAVTVYRSAPVVPCCIRSRTTVQFVPVASGQRSNDILKPAGGPESDGLMIRLPTVGSASGLVGSQLGWQMKYAQVPSIVSPTVGCAGGIWRFWGLRTSHSEGLPATSGGSAEP